MIPRTNHLRLVGLLLAVLVTVAGCAAVTSDDPSSEPTAVADARIDSDRTPTVIPEPPPTSTTPPEDVATPKATAVATATDLPEPTATSTLPPTATPTTLPTQTPTIQPRSELLPNDYGEAPEIDTEVWLNTEQPLRLEDLRGQVVLVDFWTYG